MPRTEIRARTLYLYSELTEEAKARALEAYREERSSESLPWAGEVVESALQVAKEFGRVRDYSFGEDSPCYLSLQDWEPEDEDGNPLDAEWFAEVLREKGYPVDAKGVPSFPGRCGWTGYCFDDDAAEAVYLSLASGGTVRDAMRALARKVGEQLSAERTYLLSREAFEDGPAQDSEYTENGYPVESAGPPANPDRFALLARVEVEGGAFGVDFDAGPVLATWGTARLRQLETDGSGGEVADSLALESKDSLVSEFFTALKVVQEVTGDAPGYVVHFGPDALAAWRKAREEASK